jgi:hypothetical protein
VVEVPLDVLLTAPAPVPDAIVVNGTVEVALGTTTAMTPAVAADLRVGLGRGTCTA